MITQRADGRRGAQQAEPLRADVEDLVGEDRQQRGGAAEQHREQIERDDAEHDRIAPDVGNAGEERREADGRARRRAARSMRTKASRIDRCEKERAADRVGNGRRRRRRARRRAPGPMMVASWVVDADAATARGNSDAGTTAGSKVCWVGASNARPTPKTKTAARMNSLLTQPETDAERQARRPPAPRPSGRSAAGGAGRSGRRSGRPPA